MATLSQTVQQDGRRAESARREQLSFEVRALGTSLREMFAAQVTGKDNTALHDLRNKIHDQLAVALKGGAEPLRALRALHLETFLAEVKRYEATGEESKELHEVGGPFVRNMLEAGWARGHTILLDDDERRVVYKVAWNAVAAIEGVPELDLTVDESRVLYTIYFTRPHPPEPERVAFSDMRKAASTPSDCQLIADREQQAIDRWLTEKIRRLSMVDPAYPAEFALGVQAFKAGKLSASAEYFRAHLRARPNGPWTLRARNHLKAAIQAQDL